MCSSLAVWLMFGFEMWLSEMVDYELQMGRQWERRPGPQVFGKGESSRSSWEVLQQPLVLVSEILCVYFFSVVLAWEHLPSHTLHSLSLQSPEKWGTCFPVSQEWSGSRLVLELLRGKKKYNQDFLRLTSSMKPSLFTLAASLLTAWWAGWWQQ